MEEASDNVVGAGREKRIKPLTGELHPIVNRSARVDTDAHGGQLMPCVGIDNHV